MQIQFLIFFFVKHLWFFSLILVFSKFTISYLDSFFHLKEYFWAPTTYQIPVTSSRDVTVNTVDKIMCALLFYPLADWWALLISTIFHTEKILQIIFLIFTFIFYLLCAWMLRRQIYCSLNIFSIWHKYLVILIFLVWMLKKTWLIHSIFSYVYSAFKLTNEIFKFLLIYV